MDKLFAFFRFGSPMGLFPAHDTQFYMYFCDYEKLELNLNQDEFTEYKWLAVDEALDLYQAGEIPIFHPQIMILTFLKFLNLNYMELRQCLEHGFQKNMSTYLTNKAHIFDFETLMKGPRGDSDVTSQLRKIFDKSDLTSDSFRKSDMHIFNNETLMQRHPHLQALKYDIG